MCISDYFNTYHDDTSEIANIYIYIHIYTRSYIMYIINTKDVQSGHL